MNKIKESIYKGWIILYVLTIGFAFYQVGNKNESFLMVLLSVILPFVFPIFFHMRKINMTIDLKLINIIFIYFASLIGSNLGGYNTPLYDKIIHFMSGIIAIFMVYIFYQGIIDQSIQTQIPSSFLYVFLNGVNLCIGTLWEFFEYLMLVLFNNDCIRHYTSGVHDSMTDLLCCFVGGLLFSIYIYIYHKKSHQTFFDVINARFYLANPHLCRYKTQCVELKENEYIMK